MTYGGNFRQFNRQLVEQFRATGGVGEFGPFQFDGLVLLTTSGRVSGDKHTVPLSSVRDAADNLLLFASNRAAAAHPEWYRNIEHDRHVTVELTGVSWEADAQILDGEEREDGYRLWTGQMPAVADHQARAGRAIPIVRIPRP